MTPLAACRAATASAYGPSAPRSGTSSGTKTVTWQPSWRAVAATSEPMNPPPTIATVWPVSTALCRSARSATASSMVRSRCTPGSPTPGQVAAGRCSRCDDDRVGLDRGVVGQQHGRPARRIRPQGGGVHTQMPGDVEVFGLTLQRELNLGVVGPEEILRQRRSVVGAMDFVADDHQFAGVTLRTQRAGRGQAGQGCADDGHPLRGRAHAGPPSALPAADARPPGTMPGGRFGGSDDR